MKTHKNILSMLLMACLLIASTTAAAVDYREPSSSPPGGLTAKQVPQFVVIGFDDNLLASGMDWVGNLLLNRKNPSGRGYRGTYDGTPARTSFYMNTEGLNDWLSDDPIRLKTSMMRLKQQQHEIGNHTKNHHADLVSDNWDSFEQIMTNLSVADWQPRIQQCTDDLKQQLGSPTTVVSGFRAPFLRYNQAMFTTLLQQGIRYDCSIEEGYDPSFNGKNFRWPYTLHNGSPGHSENWAGSPYNPNQVILGSTPGLWELPNHVLMIPYSSVGLRYGIQPGLRSRIADQTGFYSDRITGFDYNLWAHAKVNKTEFVGILKYNLDLRLQGNRAPMMFGAHSQFYVDPEWAANNAPQVTMTEMQSALREFIDYALSKPMVRIRPARDVISWSRNPVPLR